MELHWVSFLCVFVQDKLQEDERNTVVNLQKLDEGWRSILRQSRSTELKNDIEVLKQTFERQLDGQDSVIKVRHGLREKK